MAEWEDTANSIKPMINENSLWKQIGYKSNTEVDCEPILLTKKQKENIYPIVVEAPTGLNNPKYIWEKHMWVDQSAANNSARLTQVENETKTAKSQAQAAVDVSQKVQESLIDISKGQTEQMKQMANMLKLFAPVLAKANADKDAGGATNA